MDSTKPHLAFIGMAGVGKSAIARRVAHRLSLPSVDLDALVVAEAGCSIAEIFSDFGEAAFRELETEVLSDAVASDDPIVIATGGGIVDRPVNHERLSGRARIVWLHATDTVLTKRLTKSAVKRPLLAGDLATNLRSLRERREPLYRSLADLSIDVGDRGLTGTTTIVIDNMLAAWPDLAAVG